MNKKIIISICVVVALIIGVVSYFVVKDMKQESKLLTEASIVVDAIDFDNLNEEVINKHLSKIVTHGDYAVVEKAFKDYIHDYLYDFNVVKIVNVLNDERIVNLLSIENYKKDGKEFTESKTYLDETISFLKISKEKYHEYISDEKVLSYINDKGLDSYYVDLYKNELIGDLKAQDESDSFNKSLDSIINILDIYKQVLNLLSTNKNTWNIEDDQIVFNSQNVLDSYTNLLNKITENTN